MTPQWKQFVVYQTARKAFKYHRIIYLEISNYHQNLEWQWTLSLLNILTDYRKMWGSHYYIWTGFWFNADTRIRDYGASALLSGFDNNDLLDQLLNILDF